MPKNNRTELLLCNRLASYSQTDLDGQISHAGQGLLVAGTQPGSNSHVLWHSNVEHAVSPGAKEIALLELHQNSKHTSPHQIVFQYLLSGQVFEKAVMLDRELNRCTVEYHNTGKLPLHLKIWPRFSFRRAGICNTHAPTVQTEAYSRGVKLKALAWPFDIFVDCFQVPVQIEQGYTEPVTYSNGETDQLFCPGLIEYLLYPGERLTISVGHQKANFVARPRGNQKSAPGSAMDQLSETAYQAFYMPYNTESLPTLHSAYPSRGAQGRNPLIMLPGILLTRKAFAEAKHILATYIGDSSRFGADPDAVLWLFWALDHYLVCAKDLNFLNQKFPQLLRLMEKITANVMPGLKMNAQMLLVESALNDAEENPWSAPYDMPLLPQGNGIYISTNALWYHALWLMDQWSQQLKTHSNYQAYLAQVKHQIHKYFWCSSVGFLRNSADDSVNVRLQPYQIIAADLRSQPLTAAMRQSVVQAVERDLLTPFGLRTLATYDPEYRGEFTQAHASQREALDRGYQKPWLLCFFYGAWAACGRHSLFEVELIVATAIQRLINAEFSEHIQGFIAESFSGEAPFRRVGSCAFGPSMAALLWANYSITSVHIIPTESVGSDGKKAPVEPAGVPSKRLRP